MWISLPKMTQVSSHPKEVQISVRVKSQFPRKGLPSELWFRFPEAYRAQVSDDSDPFAVALLLLAMQNNEPLQLEGSLSRKLFEGLNRYQEIYHGWFPDRFKKIEIQVPTLREDRAFVSEVPSQEAVEACAFSGGVDSFYTLLSLLGRAENSTEIGKKRVLQAIFMAGFDMPLHLTQSIGELTDSYSEMMKDLGIDFIVGSTNIRKFVNSVDWTNSHGQALGATALFFKNSWKRFYIPSSYSEKTHPKWGTHPQLDPLLSTESMEFVHHGLTANRVEKLKVIVRAPESFSRLRVCWIQDLGLKNCGQCEKCIRTSVALEILDSLAPYSTFDAARWSRLSRQKVRSLSQRTYQSRLFAKELMREALVRRKFRIWLDLGYSLLRREIFFYMKWRTKRVNQDKEV